MVGKTNKKKIFALNEISTFETLVDPNIENRVAPNGLERIVQSAKFDNDSGQEEIQNSTQITKQESHEKIVLTSMEIKNSNSLTHENLKQFSSDEQKTQEIAKEIKEEGDGEISEYQSTGVSVNGELIARITSRENSKYAAYVNIAQGSLLDVIKEERPLIAYAFWRALGKAITISAEDAFAILFHMDESNVKMEASRQCGEALKMGELDVDIVQLLLNCIKATSVYKEEIKNRSKVDYTRNPGPLSNLVQMLQTYTFFTPDSLANINGVVKLNYFNPAMQAIEEFFKKKKLLDKPSADSVESMEQQLDGIMRTVGRQFYDKDKDVKDLVDKLYKVAENYFSTPMKFAANNPGVVISKSMKRIVRHQMQEFLKVFVSGGNESKKGSKKRFVKIGNSYYFIAQAQNFKTKMHLRMLMKVEDASSQENEQYNLIQVSEKERLFAGGVLAKYGEELIIKNIVQKDGKTYFIFGYTGKVEKKHTVSEFKVVIAELLQGAEPVLNEVVESQLKESLLSELKASTVSDFVYPAYEFKGKVLPNEVFIMLADFLNHRTMGAVITKLGNSFESSLIEKKWKIKSKVPEAAKRYAGRLNTSMSSLLYGVFITALMKIVTLLPNSTEQVCPQTKEEQKATLEKHDQTSVGAPYVAYHIMENLVLGNVDLQNNFIGSEFAFLSEQGKSRVFKNEPTEIKGPDIESVAECHYSKFLLEIYKNSKMSKLDFFRVALADMLQNELPVKIVLKAISNYVEESISKHDKQAFINQLLLKPVDHLQDIASSKLNIIQIAFMKQDQLFFKYLCLKNKKISIEKQVVIEQVKLVLGSIEPQSEFYSNWFPKHIGALPKPTVKTSIFDRKNSMLTVSNSKEENTDDITIQPTYPSAFSKEISHKTPHDSKCNVM